MCTVFLALHQHEEYPFILVANRDEFLERPASAMHWWDDSFLAGKDLEAGGTWLGMTRSGRFGIVTNHRDLSNIRKDARSRGALVVNAVQTEPKEFGNVLQQTGAAYNGFNLIYGEIDSLHFYGNHDGRSAQLSEGIFGLSNASLDTPWPKVVEGKQSFESIIKHDDPNTWKEKFLEMLASTKTYADNLLPETGVGIELERSLSALNIRMEKYGSRVSTVIIVNRNNEAQVCERNFISGAVTEQDFSVTTS